MLGFRLRRRLESGFHQPRQRQLVLTVQVLSLVFIRAELLPRQLAEISDFAPAKEALHSVFMLKEQWAGVSSPKSTYIC